jgi:hypothetical protein
MTQDKVAYVERVEKQYMTVLEILQSLPSPLVVPCEELIQVSFVWSKTTLFLVLCK